LPSVAFPSNVLPSLFITRRCFLTCCDLSHTHFTGKISNLLSINNIMKRNFISTVSMSTRKPILRGHCMTSLCKTENSFSFGTNPYSKRPQLLTPPKLGGWLMKKGQ
jgi:hypothetical protein